MINENGRTIVLRIAGLEIRLAGGGFHEKYSAPGS
jgi:hypothetical protein